MSNRGFSLIELAVVILIIALIVAGVSAGSELIRQSNIRAVISDFGTYKRAYDNFFQRFQAIPGDFNRADFFWSPGANGCASATFTCNGNGNGRIAYSTDDTSNGISEVRLAWRHLFMAEMIVGRINQINSNNQLGTGSYTIGANMLKSSVDNGGYFISGVSPAGRVVTGITSPWSGNVTRNSIYFGSQSGPFSDANGGLSAGVFSPRDAFAIDEKIDDGSMVSGVFAGANTGIIRAFNGVNIPDATRNCVTGANYNVGSLTASRFPGCVIGMQLN